ncbi:permease [Sulfurimonas sp. HSL1-2]|uniref:permease n=1 Tax=Thiomicrolovo zhangzhouensis TaxID=3131933 RepID=UPI0031F9F904
MKENSRTKEAFVKALRSLAAMTPMLLAVIGLVGLFQAFVSPEMLRTLFSGSPLLDTLIGTVIGGISIGQPVISYIIGGELLGQGISLYAVTAFILAWVTLGIIQLPLEASLFGARFTLVRNLLSFLFAMLIGFATALTLQGLS